MNGRTSKRIRRLAVKAAGTKAPASSLPAALWKIVKGQHGGLFREGFTGIARYPRGSRRWMQQNLKRMRRENPTAFRAFARDVENTRASRSE